METHLDLRKLSNKTAIKLPKAASMVTIMGASITMLVHFESEQHGDEPDAIPSRSGTLDPI